MASGLDSIVGQARAVEILGAALAAGKVHHAFLFEGPAGVGKATSARALAMALNCDERAPRGCGRCDACTKIEHGTHPDLVAVDMTPKGLTERMRDLIGLVGFRPHEGRARVVLLDPAEHLTGALGDRPEAANVLLKTLEEPPTDTHFVLVTAEPRRLPATVRSRCQRIRFRPLDEPLIERWLVDERGLDAAVARASAARAGGSLGRALALASDEDAGRATETVRGLVEAVGRGEARALFDAAGEVGDREQAALACEQLWVLLRERLVARERPSENTTEDALLGGWPSASLLVALRSTSEAVEALRGNVAPSLVLEHLMLKLASLRAAA
jgi:DNA polymerase-3 subunit delta'